MKPDPTKLETIYGKVNIKSLEQYRNKVQIGMKIVKYCLLIWKAI